MKLVDEEVSQVVDVRIKSQFSSKISLLYNFHSNDLFLNAQASIVFLTVKEKKKEKHSSSESGLKHY